MSRKPGFSAFTLGIIDTRDAGQCVSCGGRGRERHHRRRRGVNGDLLAHTPANGILVCGLGNQTGCHGLIHSEPVWARRKGYIVSPDVDPATVPMWHYSRGWVLLDEAGGWVSIPSDQRTADPMR